MVFWIGVYFFTLNIYILFLIPYYKYSAFKSLDFKRASHASLDWATSDFFDILKICNRIIPENEKINLIIPEKDKRKYEFFRGKGRYHLYPRYIGKNDPSASFILYYLIPDIKPPFSYERCIKFYADEYLYIRKGHPLTGKICNE